MKTFALFPIFIVWSSVSTIPRDNSHYVEGESRYIWMSDDIGAQHLVDLEESVESNRIRGTVNRYLLFTRSNPNNFQELRLGDINSIINSNFNSNLPIKLYAHGWGGSPTTGNARRVINSFLANGDYNVISLDWSSSAGQGYVSASRDVPKVGRNAGNFLLWLIGNFHGNWRQVHLTGFSLGAHVVGNIGRAAHGLPNRITGMDPAGPLWWNSENALAPSDGTYVEAIHTDGGVAGIMQPVGDADFYPNGGRNPQPGCILNNCSHSRAVLLFISSLYTDHFEGRKCVDLEEAENVACTGSSHNMGNSDPNKRGNGLFGLRTGSVWPF